MSDEGIALDTFTLNEGVVALQYPTSLSRESFEDLETWANLQLRKIKRCIKSSSELEVSDKRGTDAGKDE